MTKIPFLKPSIVKKDTYLDYITQIEKTRLYSNYGPLNTLFETRVVNELYQQKGSVTTVNNATSGLIVAIEQLKREKGRYALMPSFTFSATPLAAIWCGLEPYFVDIDPETLCMDEKITEDLIHELGDEIAVIVPYATFGTYINCSYYKKLHESGIPVVIDAAASFGTTGNYGSFGKEFPGVVVFSFHATKSFGIGEGGLLYSSDEQLIAKIRQAGNFGFTTNRETISKGLNSKLSEYSAAIALATLDAFKRKITMRQQIYQWYLHEINEHSLFKKGWRLPKTEGDIPHQFFSILAPEGFNNHEIITLLADNDIEARTYFSPPCHQQRFFTSFKQSKMQLTNNIAKRIVSLPLWEEMNQEAVTTIIDVLAKSDRL